MFWSIHDPPSVVDYETSNQQRKSLRGAHVITKKRAVQLLYNLGIEIPKREWLLQSLTAKIRTLIFSLTLYKSRLIYPYLCCREKIMIEGKCHCGAVSFSVPSMPKSLTNCNCSLCSRVAPLWAYYKIQDVEINSAPGATIAYSHGDKNLALHSCKNCGCTTHWERLKSTMPNRMGVNFRMCSAQIRNGIKERILDGADTWTYLS